MFHDVAETILIEKPGDALASRRGCIYEFKV
jgi:hypothetical protein